MATRASVIVLAGFLAGCVSSDTVYLKNMAGMVAQCGPYQAPYYAPSNAVAVYTLNDQLRGCVDDFQRQGYERVATP